MNLTQADIKRLYQWVVNELIALKTKVENETLPLDEVLGAFLSYHINDTLIIKGAPTFGSLQDAPIREPRGKLLIRYEPDTEELCVSAAKFRNFCTRMQVPYDSVIAYLTREGKFREVARKRLGKGTHLSANERVIVFRNIGQDVIDATKPDSAGPTDSD